MLQDITPRKFKCEFKMEYPKNTDFLLYTEDKYYLMKCTEKGYEFPTFADTKIAALFDEQGNFAEDKFQTPKEMQKEYGIYRTVAVDDTAFFIVDSKDFFREDIRFELVPKSTQRHYEPSYIYFGIVNTEQVARWRSKHRYCGKCGQETTFSDTERAIVCKKCGETIYPQICPAVTISIIHDGKILLARSKGGTFRKYGQIAGYVEIGETFEDTVKREAFEETGLHLTNIRYYKNQPWPLTDAHMVGFTAEVAGADDVTVQESELTDARWFAPNEIPEDISDISLTYEMIGEFRKKYLKETDLDQSEPYRELFDLRG